MEYFNIKLMRIKSGLTQSQLAKAIGVTQSTIARWESGNRPITVDQLYKIAHALNVDIKSFFEG